MRWLAFALLLGWACAAAAEPPPPLDEADPGLRVQIAEWLRVRSPWPVTSVELPALEAFVLANEPPDLAVDLSTHPDEPLLGTVPVRVRLESSGRVLRDGIVTANVHAELPVVVAARDLKSGRPLVPADLTVELRDAAELRAGWLDDPSQAVGRRPRRPLRRGMALAPDSLDAAAPVRRGQRVKLRLAQGRLRIETEGQAREDGQVGDWIRVLNLASRREVLARVDDDGTAHVGY
jgi:flagella basal body P-ring formation protein FlgA